MFEPAAGQEDRQVAGVVGVGVAEVAAEEDGRAIEQGRTGFGLRFHLAQQAAETVHDAGLDLLQLGDLGHILAVVRQVVVVTGHAFDLRDDEMVLDHDADEPAGIGLHDQRYQVHQELRATDQVTVVENVGGLFGVDGGLGLVHPSLHLLDVGFGLADRLEEFVQQAVVRRAGLSPNRTGL